MARLQPFKNSLRKLLFTLGIDLTKNQQYDRQTLAIMKKVLRADSNCIDVGCHKGEVMDEIIQLAPNGHHFGFEPIPDYFNYLEKKYKNNPNIHILKNALSDSDGKDEFNWVKNAPAYSGLKERSYNIKNPFIEKIQVQLAQLNECGADFPHISLIKIDVEGAELKVLKGGMKFIQQHQPIIIFEFGIGAADFYNTQPQDIYDYFNQINYQLNSLKGYLNSTEGLTNIAFNELYAKNIEYYFIAYPSKA